MDYLNFRLTNPDVTLKQYFHRLSLDLEGYCLGQLVFV